jgi:hypothetical protein
LVVARPVSEQTRKRKHEDEDDNTKQPKKPKQVTIVIPEEDNRPSSKPPEDNEPVPELFGSFFQEEATPTQKPAPMEQEKVPEVKIPVPMEQEAPRPPAPAVPMEIKAPAQEPPKPVPMSDDDIEPILSKFERIAASVGKMFKDIQNPDAEAMAARDACVTECMKRMARALAGK